MRSPLSYATCKDTCPPSRYNNNLWPVALSALSAEPSRIPPPRRRLSVALGSLWPKSLALLTSKRSYESSEKVDNRETAAAAIAVAGHRVSSLSALVYILRAIPKMSVSCEQL